MQKSFRGEGSTFTVFWENLVGAAVAVVVGVTVAATEARLMV
jgi:hypothetical protein